jgi:K+-transporting ATPase A subunit
MLKFDWLSRLVKSSLSCAMQQNWTGWGGMLYMHNVCLGQIPMHNVGLGQFLIFLLLICGSAFSDGK